MAEKESREKESSSQQTFMASTVNIPNEYKPISMWGYFGYEILFSIPCIGFIMLCVFAFGGTTNINLKNFARSYFCFLIIGIILIFIVFAILAFLGVFATGTNGGFDTSRYGM